jgi:hypothetical protein
MIENGDKSERSDDQVTHILHEILRAVPPLPLDVAEVSTWIDSTERRLDLLKPY